MNVLQSIKFHTKNRLQVINIYRARLEKTGHFISKESKKCEQIVCEFCFAGHMSASREKV